MVVTFGSFGDIVAAVQVAYKLIEVLSSQRGAAREFRDLLVDLRLFHRFLDQLISFWQTRQSDPLIDSLYDVLQPSICDAKGEITTYLERMISRYGRNLLTPSKSNVKDVGKMIQWHVLEQDNIARLQDKLRKSKDIILLVQSQAHMVLEEQNRSVVVERMDMLMKAELEAMAKLGERLERLELKTEEQTKALGLISSGVQSISSTLAPIARATLDLPAMLTRIYTEILSQRAIFCRLNPYSQNSAVFEDALGWTFEVPLELICSWNTLHAILMDRFERRPGFELVKSRRYVMRDDLNGTELRRDLPLNLALRPKQKINMFMVYFSGGRGTMSCPRCKQTTLSAEDAEFTCLNPRCAMEIQRVEEVFDDGTQINAMNIDAEDNSRTIESDLDDTTPLDLARFLQKEDSPEVFKRVRFLSRWEFRIECRGQVDYRVGQYYWWRALGIEATMMKEVAVEALKTKLPGNMTSNEEWVNCIGVGLHFVGTSLEQARPVLTIFAMSKVSRKAASKLAGQMDWFKSNPSLILNVTCHRTFHHKIKAAFAAYKGSKER